MVQKVVCFIVTFLWIIFIFAFIKDRSRYRNCYLLFIAITFTIIGGLVVAGRYQRNLFVSIMGIGVITLLIVPFFLIINGIMMIKRERFSIANILSLAFGLMIGMGEIATFLAIVMPDFMGMMWYKTGYLLEISRISMFFSVSVIYVSISFVVFMLYCVFLQIIPIKRNFDYVIIHGAGLIKGEKISKLLANRLDKAIEIYQKAPTSPILIPSGGNGSDEKISEAEAMEKYLLEKGIPADKIIKEDKSTTTFENLKNSKEIIEAQTGNKNIALVTSNYHVYRALRYCRKIGLKCNGVGSKVAFYFWPSALIREYIAIHAEKKHLVFLVAGWLMCMIPLGLAYFR